MRAKGQFQDQLELFGVLKKKMNNIITAMNVHFDVIPKEIKFLRFFGELIFSRIAEYVCCNVLNKSPGETKGEKYLIVVHQ